ncbi:hypothetical protein GCM10010124_25010 [Pilimelia terevasa]|uniref:Lytic transglycosylase domain-containing protein n=1 Tax=Pilimelia terevasa TaxID=53372 RepID=A0A8J3BLL7_9ACTN|nr:lytic transglycosylase domain-containing protein [Pilimelia terevasa]GGK31170.1 hypothetical protein GCM10010124_25010 [Pilimelia terevasa]
MSPQWSRLTVRSLSVALLLSALGGGFYAGYGTDGTPSPEAAPAPDQLAAQQTLDERDRLSAVASRQRSAQQQVARNALASARSAAAKAKRAEDAAKKKQQEKKRKAAAGGTVPFDGPIPSSCDEYSGNRAIGCALTLKAGWDLQQVACLERLWTKESGWNHKAENSGSGAYGIPQAFPGSKMGQFGADWQTNPATQIRWGLNYIKTKKNYRTPCGAWTFFKNNGWY